MTLVIRNNFYTTATLYAGEGQSEYAYYLAYCYSPYTRISGFVDRTSVIPRRAVVCYAYVVPKSAGSVNKLQRCIWTNLYPPIPITGPYFSFSWSALAATGQIRRSARHARKKRDSEDAKRRDCVLVGRRDNRVMVRREKRRCYWGGNQSERAAAPL